MNQFMLPDIAKANVEESGESIHCDYSKNAVYDGYMLPVESIIINNGIPVYYSDLPDNCFGRIYFRSATAVVFNKQPYFNKLINMSMKLKPGNIILNKNRYELGSKDDELITIAHELVHWKKHQKYYRLLEILESESETMSCDIEPIVFDDSMTPIQKAHFYAECQADALAFRVAMPKTLVEEALQKIEENSKPYKYKTDYYEDIVKKFSQLFGVSRDISKQRLRQLGYDWADSIFLRVNNKYYDSFSFAPGTLKENETFIIDRANYEKLISEDKKVAELINSRMYIYLGYVVCVFDAKYIIPVRKNGKVVFTLSEYAREHAGECCRKFALKYKLHITDHYEYCGKKYFCKIDADKYGKYNDDNIFELSPEATNDREEYLKKEEERKKAKKILADMELNNIHFFKDALNYHMQRKNKTISEISDEFYLKEDTLKAYLAKPDSPKYRKPSLDKVMILCNFLQLEYLVAIDLIKKREFPK